MEAGLIQEPNAALRWIVDMSATVPGWRQLEESMALAAISYGLPEGATIVEVGVYMGRGTVVLAGARRLRGNGRIHAIDPFDCSGDAFSTPYYKQGLQRQGASTLEDVFRGNLRRFALENIVTVHKGHSRQIALAWTDPIDMLFLDGDHSPVGAREAFETWVPFVRSGGTIAIDNSTEREYAPTHDGNYLIVKERVRQPFFSDIRYVAHTTLCKKV
jgi:predicted O-methyltransferase YrrM